MAIAKGHLHSGKIGHLIGRIVNGKQVLQSIGKKPRQTDGAKKSAELFGTNSSIAFWIRHILCNNADKDSAMVNRLNSATYAVIRQCNDKTMDSFTFTQDSFDSLRGFEFNLNSPLIKHFWIKPQLKIENQQLNVTLPEFQVPKHLRFPMHAISCTPILDILLYVPSEGALWESSYELDEIKNTKGTVSYQEFNVTVPPGCICFVGLSLFYYSKEHNLKKMMNHKGFSPAGICGVILNPGITSADDLASGWNDDEDIKLNNVRFSELNEIDPEEPKFQELANKEVSTAPPISKIMAAKSIKIKKAELQSASANKENNPLFAVAQNLRNMGLTDEDIAKATGLSVEEINRINKYIL